MRKSGGRLILYDTYGVEVCPTLVQTYWNQIVSVKNRRDRLVPHDRNMISGLVDFIVYNNHNYSYAEVLRPLPLEEHILTSRLKYSTQYQFKKC